MKQIFPKNFSPFWPYDVVLTSKTALCEQFEQFLQISAFYSIITWKLPHNTRVEIVYNTQNIILKQFFPKIFHHLTLRRHLDPQNRTFLANFADVGLLLNYNMETILKTMVKIVHNSTGVYFETIISQIFHHLALRCHIDPQNRTSSAF